jgi:capsular polysaccharide transport system permease protein
VVVVVPAVIAGVYYFLIAADQYVAEFRFALRTAEPVRAEAATTFGNVAPSPVGVDSYAVVQYIASRDIIDDLSKTLDLRAMFSRPEADWPARLQLPVTIEELVRYWKNQVDGFFDVTNGTIVVRARAFTPEDSLKLAQGILASSEGLVNELSARARRDTLQNSDKQVRSAERRLKTALAHLREFRDREGIIDPRKTADATQALAGRIRDQLVNAETELATVKHYMRADAPSVRMLEARIQSLQTQLRSVESEVTDTERSRSEVLSRVMGSYEQLENERIFAEKAYQHALEALDRSRVNADRQQVYIAGFVQPSLPEEALHPRRLRAFAIVVFLCCVIWLLGAVTVQTVREHL